MLTYSCEKADQTTTSNVALNGQLASREVASCDQCPQDDCCCSIESIPHSQTMSFRFCGTSDGTLTCNTPGSGACSTIMNGGQAISLSSTGFRKLFCMNPDNAFSVTNTTGGTATIILTCQHDQVNPQKDTITIANGVTVYFDTTSGCVISQCQ